MKPKGGVIQGPAYVCSGSAFQLSFKPFAGSDITRVDWFQIDSSNGSYDYLGGGAAAASSYLINVPSSTGTAITSTTTFQARLTGTCGDQYPTQNFVVTVLSTNKPGQVYGAKDAVIGDNSGVLLLGDYNGSVLEWQMSEDDGVTWQSIVNTTDQLSYSGLTQTTLYKAKVQHCIGTGFSFSLPAAITINGLNWTESKAFDETGALIGDTRSYFDAAASPVQTQSRNLAKNRILASQPLYDAYCKPAGQTLPAPVSASNTDLAYEPKFVTKSNNPDKSYDYRDFDTPVTAPGTNSPGTPLNPVAVGTGSGTLGWYYGNSPTKEEKFVAASTLPFSRTYAGPDASLAVIRSVGPADADGLGGGSILRLGQGHESQAGDMPVTGELSKYLELRGSLFSATALGELPTNLAQAANQQVVVDPNGQVAVRINDRDGHALMQARPASTTDYWLQTSNSASLGWAHRATMTGGRLLRVKSPSDILVYNVSGSLYYEGAASAMPSSTSGNFTIYSATSFAAFYETTAGGSTVETELTSTSDELPQFLNFYKTGGTSVNVTTDPNLPGTEWQLVKSIDASSISGTIVAEVTASNTSTQGLADVPDGYYQLRVLKGRASVSYSNYFKDISYNFYNHLGQLVSTLAPNGVQKVLAAPSLPNPVPFYNTFEYDALGRLIAQVDADAGRTEFLYRQDGKVRFSQNAEQRKVGAFNYVIYDPIGRPIEAGEFQGGAGFDFATTMNTTTRLDDMTAQGGLPQGTRAEVVKTLYDVPNSDHNLGTGSTDFPQDYLAGRVSMTAKYATITASTSELVSRNWFSYTDQGQLAWHIQKTESQPARTLEYAYDFNGNVVSVVYQRKTPTERLVHYYEYDADKRLKQVSICDHETTIQSEKLPQAQYEYYLHGPLKRVVIGANLQGVDYVYTAQGWLKSVNHADRSPLTDPGGDNAGTGIPGRPDLFGMTMDYYGNDYRSPGMPSTNSVISNSGTARYDGTMRSIAWKKASTQVNEQSSVQSFSYDDKGQLAAANYGLLAGTGGVPGPYSFTPDPMQAYQERNLAYDPNGNILTMQRTGKQGASLMNGHYVYQTAAGDATGNKLMSVHEGSATGTPLVTYEYNDLGQMTSQQESGTTTYLKYNAAGLVTGVFLNSDRQSQQLASYTYDEYGKRLIQKVWAPTASGPNGPARVTYYSRDALGREMAVYVADPQVLGGATYLFEQPVYGASRVGTRRFLPGVAVGSTNPPNPEVLYELNDHLGNARVIFHKPVAREYVATMESGVRTQEENTFGFPAGYDPRSTDYAHGTSTYSAKLGSGHMDGPSKTLSVTPGDELHLEVFALYPDGAIPMRAAGALAAGLSGLGKKVTVVTSSGTTPTQQTTEVGNNQGIRRFLNRVSFGLAFPLAAQAIVAPTEGEGGVLLTTNATPDARLEYTYKDRDGNVITTGSQAVSTSASGSWEKLQLDLSPDQAGTVEVRLRSYDGGTIYFDDLKINHLEGMLLQESHYYPYGEKIADLSWARQGIRKYRHGYQGQYSYEDEETGYNSFELRLYSAKYGRWLSADPKKQYNSPYVSFGNNPVYRVDPDGGSDDDFVFDKKSGAYIETIPTNLPDRIVLRNTGTGVNEDYFSFNDPVVDANELRSMIDVGYPSVLIATKGVINQLVGNTGATSTSENRWTYVIRESLDNGKMDPREHFTSNATFYVVPGTGKAYNRDDFGNFIWGRAAHELGFSLFDLLIGAHVNNAIHYLLNENQNLGSNTFLDSPADQRAIRDGVIYPNSQPRATDFWNYGTKFEF